MITIETFFVLSVVVVLIGLVVWRRDVKSGRILRPKVRGPVTVMRQRFAAKPATSGTAVAATPTGADAAERKTVERAPASGAPDGGASGGG